VGAAHPITLPHGLFVGGEWRRDVRLRLPTGADEEFLLENGRELTPAERVSALLGRCLIDDGLGAQGAELARALTVGDREALLLHLRALLFGDRLSCMLACPGCGEPMDVDLRVRELLVSPYRRPHRRHRAALDAGGSRWDVRFRLPTGADQEAAAREAGLDAGLRTLVARCVESVRVDGEPIDALPDALLTELSAALAQLDPQAEILLRLACPACGAECVPLLDAATVVFGELAGSEQRLFEEVHALARSYHWSEAEILSLDIRRRRRYLELTLELAELEVA
jgi:hypothetical protein